VNFSRDWDDAYRVGTHLTTWPFSDLVSLVYRYAKPADGFCAVLELGCGVGFFRRLGVDYRAIEGSSNAVARLLAAYPDLSEKVAVGDFTQMIPFDGPFDLVVDRAALVHNPTEAIRRTMGIVRERLRTGGKLIGIDWFSDQHQDAKRGDEVDLHTRTNFASGPFAGIGNVHFCDQGHLQDLVSGAGLSLQYP
jgi:SAM-dependent methyltransferase